MKKLILLLSLAIVLAFILPWGNPLLTWKQLKQYKSAIPLPATVHDDQREVTVYRWRDTEGNWHFSNEPPAEGIDYQVLEVNPDTNLIPGLPGKNPPPASGGEAENASLFGYSAEDLNKLLDGSGDADEAIKQRQEQQEAAIEQGQ